MSRLENLLEQTSFLVKKQQEAKALCAESFGKLLKSIEDKIAEAGETSEDSADLNKIYDLIAGQAQQLLDETQEDITYLQGQETALRDISRIKDATKAQELLNAIIDPEEELLETEEFKAGIIEEVKLSQESFEAVANDIMQALEEGELSDVLAQLETMAENAGDLDIDLSGLDDEDEEEEEDGCCGSGGCSTGGSCGNCKVGGCSTGDGKIDIFSTLSKYEQELARDSKKKND